MKVRPSSFSWSSPATAAFGLRWLRWSCGVRSIGLKFIIESRHLSWLLRINAMRREQSFLSATPMLKLEMHVPGRGPAAG
jgi:hypothetical protein